MTVAELIEKLREFDPWLPILIPSQSSEMDYEESGTASAMSISWMSDDEDSEDDPEHRLCVVIEP